jgi:Transglutaminase-like superfamily
MHLVVARLWFWAAVVRSLKHVVPVVTLVRIVHARPAGRQRASGLADRLDTLFRRTGRFPRRPPSNCLERSLGAYRLLCRAGAQPELVIGMKRGPDDAIEGHTWVMVDGRPLGENQAVLAAFGRVLAFDVHGRQTTGPARLPQGIRIA